MPTTGVYAATKWGIEGFFEGTIPEIATFGIEVTLVEPGRTRTNLVTSRDRAEPMPIYENTAAGDFRRAAAAAGIKAWRGDPRKIAAVVIASVDQRPAPRRLTFGSDAYAAITSR